MATFDIGETSVKQISSRRHFIRQSGQKQPCLFVCLCRFFFFLNMRALHEVFPNKATVVINIRINKQIN